ncbi:MAG TPA: deaminase [Acidobacteriota bacterium]|nr:deaminase [Acidobacteriota bacterium]
MTTIRPSKIEYYLNIAEEVARRGTCLRRNFGAVIVHNDQIVSTGYTGAPRQTANCLDIGHCQRQAMNVPSGERYELCRSVHAEMNAIIHARRSEMLGGTLYLVGLSQEGGGYVEATEPCKLCKRVIINAGLERVIVRRGKERSEEILVARWVTAGGEEI